MGSRKLLVTSTVTTLLALTWAWAASGSDPDSKAGERDGGRSHHTDRVIFQYAFGAFVDGGFIEQTDREWPKESKASRDHTVKRCQAALCMLGFLDPPYAGPDDPAFGRALVAYAEFAGLPQSKRLNGRLISALLAEFGVLMSHGGNEISLPLLFITPGSNYVHAEGVWSGVGQPVANRQNAISIDCYRPEGICVSAQAELASNGRLSVFTEILPIERWDAYELVTKPRDAVCARWVTRINFRAKSVTTTRTNISPDGDKACQVIGKDDWTLRLVDGNEVETQLRNERHKELETVLGRKCPMP